MQIRGRLVKTHGLRRDRIYGLRVKLSMDLEFRKPEQGQKQQVRQEHRANTRDGNENEINDS